MALAKPSICCNCTIILFKQQKMTSIYEFQAFKKYFFYENLESLLKPHSNIATFLNVDLC